MELDLERGHEECGTAEHEAAQRLMLWWHVRFCSPPARHILRCSGPAGRALRVCTWR